MSDGGSADGLPQIHRLRCTINDKPMNIEIDPTETLFDTLRERLGLTGTKGACLEGECGSCTVLLDGKPVTSCLVMTPQVEGRSITTIEGIEKNNRLHVVQECFIACGAVQCGYCTPGLIVATVALLEKNPRPSTEDIRRGLAGNLCRCTGYTKIVDAVLDAAARARSESEGGLV